MAKRSFAYILKEHIGYARNGIKYFFKNENQMWLSFLLPALILLVSYFIFGVWPFGSKSVLSLDLNGQYVYYYDHMYDVIYGDESLFYSWSRNLSGEWMGIIGYYLGSPFNLIVWLFPRTWITEGLLTMMCVKVGAIGLAMSVYLSRGRGMKKLTTVVFSICYALCAYTIVQTMNPMWLDGVMALPVICLGIERFIDQGRFRLLVAAWVYAFVTCFYIGYMLAIFSVIYFLLYMIITKSSQAREHFLKKLFGALGLGITAVLISCFMLIPVYESLSYGKFEFSTPDYSLISNFNLIEVFDKILPNSYDTCRMEGLPFIYCGVITVLLLPAYFLHNKIRRSEKIGYAAVMLLMLICMYIRPVDMLWHGGQLPNWLPYRYSFILSFLMVVCAAAAFDRLKEASSKCIGMTCAAWLALMIYQESMDNFVEDLNNGRDTLDNFSVILPAMLILFVMTAFLLQLRKKFNYNLRKNQGRFISVLLIIIISAEAMYNTVGQLNTQHTDITYSGRATYSEYIPALREAVNEIYESDDGFYRIEKLFFRTVNDPLAVNMYGLSHSSSTLNAKPIELLKRMGFTARSHYTRYSGATLITSSIFGVKYELSTDNNLTSDVREGKEIYVTENEYALPICYLADNEIQNAELAEYDPFTAQTQLLNALIGKDYQYYTRIIDTGFTTQNVTQGTTTDGHHSFKVNDSGSEASLTYTITMPSSGNLYMYLPSVYERTVTVTVNGESMGNYFEGDDNYMRNFGYFEEGELVTVVLTLTRDNLYFKEAQFAVDDEEQIKAALTELLELNSDTLCYKNSATDVITEVSCGSDMTLFTTIPAEEGWTVYVDGVKTDYIETVDALIAVPLTAGAHTVELKFTAAGYPAAVIISVAGILIFAGAILLWLKYHPKDRKRRREHLRSIYSGEAYQLLLQQEKEDIAQRRRNAERKREQEDEEYEEDEGSDPRLGLNGIFPEDGENDGENGENDEYEEVIVSIDDLRDFDGGEEPDPSEEESTEDD